MRLWYCDVCPAIRKMSDEVKSPKCFCKRSMREIEILYKNDESIETRLKKLLDDAWDRMDKSRNILRDSKLGNPKSEWTLLDTAHDRNMLDNQQSGK